MPFILPKGADREYLTVNGITAVYIVESDDEVIVGVSRDLYQTLIALRRERRFAAIVGAYWLKSEAEAEAICAELGAWNWDSKITAAMTANRIEAIAESLGIAVTDHHVLMLRVRAAVDYVEERLAEAQETGALRFFNRAYRQWRLAAKAEGRAMTYAEARARLRRSLYRQIAMGEPMEIRFPALENRLTG